MKTQTRHSYTEYYGLVSWILRHGTVFLFNTYVFDSISVGVFLVVTIAGIGNSQDQQGKLA